MQLKDFVKATINEISEAIRELQTEMSDGTVINPTLAGSALLKTSKNGDIIRSIQQIQFDVAVSVTESSSSGKNARFGILNVLAADIDNSEKAKAGNTARLTFSIPVVFPATLVEISNDLPDVAARKIRGRGN